MADVKNIAGSSLQLSTGAGIGAFVTLSAAVMVAFVFVLSLWKGEKDITVTDTAFLLLALFTLSIWLLAKQPMISAILVTLTELFIFAPTVRKSWKKPYSETLSFYVINSVRFILAIFSLAQYSVITAFYPVSWGLANGFFALLLLVRRHQLGKK